MAAYPWSLEYTSFPAATSAGLCVVPAASFFAASLRAYSALAKLSISLPNPSMSEIFNTPRYCFRSSLVSIGASLLYSGDPYNPAHLFDRAAISAFTALVLSIWPASSDIRNVLSFSVQYALPLLSVSESDGNILFIMSYDRGSVVFSQPSIMLELTSSLNAF
ncbi:hypothetical protein SDC9_199183 [bioreactor metagenome]|uniref:Uncharacterized protein n=1 Tax=bioreactor metagenome TaxID=1076179 RepID=A0A645IJR8_9ZZZZ